MSQLNRSPRGLYFEDFQPGQSYTSAGRTITESDIVAFAGLSGDFNPMHVDAEYCRNTQFGQRVAHGLLGLSIASGLAVQTGILDGTVLYFREVGEWKFIKPILIGDSIYVEMEVLETKEMRRVGAGMVTIELNVKNQHNEVVQKGNWVVLVALRS
jgi:3-hydroxybutyryl-CoA dehydratase